MCLKLNVFPKKMFPVQLPGFKNGAGRCTWLFIPKQEHLTGVHMCEQYHHIRMEYPGLPAATSKRLLAPPFDGLYCQYIDLTSLYYFLLIIIYWTYLFEQRELNFPAHFIWFVLDSTFYTSGGTIFTSPSFWWGYFQNIKINKFNLVVRGNQH